MSDEQIVTLTDASIPNAGRVYDYLLGGHTNFEIDRKAGDELKKSMPFIVHVAQLIRWFLGKGVTRALELGFTHFIDFASGLPTVNHIHLNTPPGTKIIYSDIDPITVQYGQKIVADNPLIKYETCDIRTPEKLLNSATVKNLFGNNRKVAVGYNGICYFLTDEQLQYSLKVIYDWAETGSILFFCDNDLEDVTKVIEENKEAKAMYDAYKNMNQQIYFRSQKKIKELIKPWKILEPGFLSLERWHDLPESIKENVINFNLDKGGGFYGGFLIK